MAKAIRWRRQWMLVTSLRITLVRMFFYVGGGVISCADGWYILVFDSFNVCYNTKVHDIIKVEKEERDASKEDTS